MRSTLQRIEWLLKVIVPDACYPLNCLILRVLDQAALWPIEIII